MDAKLKSYLSKLKGSGSLNLPLVAAQCNLDYGKDIAPVLESDAEFRGAIQVYFDELRFQLLDSILDAARSGVQVNVNAAKTMIGIIKKNEILGPEQSSQGQEEIKDILAKILGQGQEVKETPD